MSNTGAAFIAGRALRAGAALLPEAVALGGVWLVARGAWMVYHPAGLITAGVLLLAGVVLHGRGAA